MTLRKRKCQCQAFFLCMALSILPADAFADCTSPASAPTVMASGSAVQFRHSDDPVESKLGVSLLASLAILAAGAAAIYLGKRRSGLLGSREFGAQIKVLNVRRISSKLTIVMIEADEGRRIVFADNSQSLLLLSDSDASLQKKQESALL